MFPGLETQPTIAQGVAVAAPATPAVVQQAAPADFNVFAFAKAVVKAESATKRKDAWECSAEELRARVTFKDVQAVSKRNPAEYHMRAFLSPRPIPMEEVLGNDAEGNPINTIIVPAQYADAAKAQFMQGMVNAGHLDAILLRIAQEMKVAKEEKANAPKRAPVNTAAADQALADLSGLSQVAPVPQQAVPIQGAAGLNLGTLPTFPM